MFATVREGTYDPVKMARGKAQVDEFWQIRAQQPGYQGAVTVDVGDGRVLIITLWQTPEQGQAAQAVLDPQAQRLMEPLQSVPSRIIGRGNVIYNDLTRG